MLIFLSTRLLASAVFPMKPLSLFVSFYLHFVALSVPLQLSELRFQVDLDASQGLEAWHEQQVADRGSAEDGTPMLQLRANGLRHVEMGIVLRFCCRFQVLFMDHVAISDMSLWDAVPSAFLCEQCNKTSARWTAGPKPIGPMLQSQWTWQI